MTAKANMTPKILIVDDEEVNRLMLEAFLSDEGYELISVSRGGEAFGAAQEYMPDLVLLDVMMPDVDGFTVCRQIRADPIIGRMPILLITALNDSASRLKGLNAGADDFVTKPCRREELRARVRTIVSLNRLRSIAESRARFQQLYEQAPLAIMLVDPAGLVAEANPMASELFSVGAERALVGLAVAERFDHAEAMVVRAGVSALMAGESRAPSFVRLPTPTGNRILQMRMTAVPDGDHRAALLIFDDVTAEFEARAALKAANDELEEKVRSRTRQLSDANTLLLSYASFVSHDLRSPLTVVKGYLGMIQEGVVPINPESAPLVSQAFDAATMMDELIHNILQLARETHEGPRTGERIATDPTPIIARLVHHLRSLAPNQQTEFVVGSLPSVGVSSVVIERVFYNVLANAQKYCSSQGAPRVEIGTVESEDGPEIFVRDNGIGFDSREADRLFLGFSRLSNSTGTDGIGLGLSFVSRLMESHGGRIRADGQRGAGAVFYLKFPAPTKSGV